MNLQTRASFKKELLAYLRTHRFLVIGLSILGLAIFSPLLIAGMGSFMYAFSDFYYDEMGMDVTEMVDMLGSTTAIGVASAVEWIVGAGVIVMIVLLNRAAGGEQKKRAVIIPKSAGLRNFSYLLPKFIIYPLSVLFFSVVALLAAWGISILVFDTNDVSFSTVLLAGVLAGVHMMFYACMHLTLGTATSKAGMSSAICITISILLPTMFAMYTMDYMFNPFTLGLLAQTTVLEGAVTASELIDFGISTAFVLGLMALAFLVALFAQNAKRVDNTGNEIRL